MSESDAALMWFGLAGLSRETASCAADGFDVALAALADFAVDSAFAETAFAMARTSSRLSAIGLVAAFRARMLSRNADFLDGFSMVGRFSEATGAGGAALGTGAFFVPLLSDFFLDGLVFFVFAMGSLGIVKGSAASGIQGLRAPRAYVGERALHEGGHPAPAPRAAHEAELGTGPHIDRKRIPGLCRSLNPHIGADKDLGQRIYLLINDLSYLVCGRHQKRHRGVQGLSDPPGRAQRLDRLIDPGPHLEQ